uniref:Uncharacterized protein n=1 Tax=Siphoviridae sp. ctnPP24 TaxID=2825662 RepID=A0A8S5TZ91_9CAUD|nr:MAG TPA: hypothetical protein [Siphoviridae sp. ctnPP24]
MALHVDRADAKIQLTGHDNFAVVEPNHLSAPRSGGVYGQLPADDSIEMLEQGTFVKYDYAAGKVDFTGEGPWMMVFNEEKLYDERKQMHRDYAMKKSDFYDGVMTPRVFRMYAGDIFTTNNVKAGDYNLGDVLVPGDAGVLESGAKGEGLAVKVVKLTTMPDGQPGLKLQVIAE